MEQDSIQQKLNKMLEDYRKNIVRNLDNDYIQRTKFGERIADKIASFGGSWGFIFSFAVFLLLWLVWNILPGVRHFDPGPFILLNLILSFLAGFQAPFIMMAQNRHAARDKVEADIDFAINYRSEIEIEELQNSLHGIETKLSSLERSMEDIRSMLSRNSPG